MFRNVKVMPRVTLDSDHRLLVMDIKVVKNAEQQSHKRKVIKTTLLKDPVMGENYKQRLNDILEEIEKNNRRSWPKLKETMVDVSIETLGIEWIGGNRRRHTP